jgi:hypothetical protein
MALRFNLRHKALLFLTLLAAGLTLFLGAGVEKAAGVTLFGVAAAWLIGGLSLWTLWLTFNVLVILAGGCVAALPVRGDWQAYRAAARSYDRAISTLADAVRPLPAPESPRLLIAPWPAGKPLLQAKGPPWEFVPVPNVVGAGNHTVDIWLPRHGAWVGFLADAEPEAIHEAILRRFGEHGASVIFGPPRQLAPGSKPSRLHAPGEAQLWGKHASVQPARFDYVAALLIVEIPASVQAWERSPLPVEENPLNAVPNRPSNGGGPDAWARAEIGFIPRDAASVIVFPRMSGQEALDVIVSKLLLPRPTFSIWASVERHRAYSLSGIAVIVAGLLGLAWFIATSGPAKKSRPGTGGKARANEP